MMHARCSIISLAYELADEWNIGFIFTDEFFSTALCEATIGEVFRCFVSKFGPAPYPEFAASDVVPVNSTHGIRLTLRRGYLRFETVWSRNRLALGIGSV
jgi:hypothetical protein